MLLSMLLTTGKAIRRLLATLKHAMILAVSISTVLLTASPVLAWQHDQQTSGTSGTPSDKQHKCDDLSSMGGMSVMGQSMAAMTNHMCITPMRPKQPGDEEKAKALVAEVKATIEKYKDYKKALADGYVIANPTVVQPQYHFTNDANVRLADTQFNPTKPSALLYYQTPSQHYKLEGVMFTDSTSATEDELNERIPLSIARWHEHTNFCGAPANKVSEYHG